MPRTRRRADRAAEWTQALVLRIGREIPPSVLRDPAARRLVAPASAAWSATLKRWEGRATALGEVAEAADALLAAWRGAVQHRVGSEP